MRFQWHGGDLDMLDHPYNATITNERAIEIPIVLDFMRTLENGHRVLEVGNVLGHYLDDMGGSPSRRIVDKYEVAPGVQNLDVFAIDGMYDFIVSVSTIEHVRFEERPQNPWGAIAAIAYLRGLLAPGGHMVITAGLGQNPELDRFVLQSDGDRADVFDAKHEHVYSRLDKKGRPLGRWEEPEWFLTAEQIVYGPTHGANTVWIGEWA